MVEVSFDVRPTCTDCRAEISSFYNARIHCPQTLGRSMPETDSTENIGYETMTECGIQDEEAGVASDTGAVVSNLTMVMDPDSNFGGEENPVDSPQMIYAESEPEMIIPEDGRGSISECIHGLGFSENMANGEVEFPENGEGRGMSVAKSGKGVKIKNAARSAGRTVVDMSPGGTEIDLLNADGVAELDSSIPERVDIDLESVPTFDKRIENQPKRRGRPPKKCRKQEEIQHIDQSENEPEVQAELQGKDQLVRQSQLKKQRVKRKGMIQDNQEGRRLPQCEIWSCKALATYRNLSTGAPRCSLHRATSIVRSMLPGMLTECGIDGCHHDKPAHANKERRPLKRPRLQTPGSNVTSGKENRRGGGAVGSSGSSGFISSTAVSGVVEPAAVKFYESAVQNPLPGGVLDPKEMELLESDLQRFKKEHDELRQRMASLEMELARLQEIHKCEIERRHAEAEIERAAKRGLQLKSQLSQQALAPGAKLDIRGPMHDGEVTTGSCLMLRPLIDGYNWRKFNEIVPPGTSNLRVFYGCVNMGCIARKIEEHTVDGHVRHVYEGSHNHPQPRKCMALLQSYKRKRKQHKLSTDRRVLN